MVYSSERIPGSESLAPHERLATLLRYKLKQEYSEMCGFVWARISLAIVRSNSLLLHVPRNIGACIWQQPELTDGAVMARLRIGGVNLRGYSRARWEDTRSMIRIWRGKIIGV